MNNAQYKQAYMHSKQFSCHLHNGIFQSSIALTTYQNIKKVQKCWIFNIKYFSIILRFDWIWILFAFGSWKLREKLWILDLTSMYFIYEHLPLCNVHCKITKKISFAFLCTFPALENESASNMVSLQSRLLKRFQNVSIQQSKNGRFLQLWVYNELKEVWLLQWPQGVINF